LFETIGQFVQKKPHYWQGNAFFHLFCRQKKKNMRKLSMDELNRLSKEDFEQAEKLPIIIVLDNIRSLSNVGAFFRTADAFRIGELMLCGITACPPHREIHKTALGADETVKWRYFETTEAACQQLKAEGYRIFAIEQVEDSVPLQDFNFEPHTAYLLGNEVEGVSEEALPYCEGAIELPQEGTKHSINVSVCAGIVMWKLFEQLHLKPK
jgi:tRNA G18 (ribose-2'-O)-methylase SpoU